MEKRRDTSTFLNIDINGELLQEHTKEEAYGPLLPSEERSTNAERYKVAQEQVSLQ